MKRLLVFMFVTLFSLATLLHPLGQQVEAQTKKNLYPKLTLNEKKQIISFMNNFTNTTMKNFDIKKNSTYDVLQFFIDATINGLINLKEYSYDPSMPGYARYSAKQIVELAKQFFGISLKLQDYPKNGVKYKKGYFYFPDGKGSSIEISSSQVNTMYDLGKEIYYVKFTIYSGEWTQLQELGLDRDVKFLYNPMETWSTKQKSFFFDEKKYGYAFLKKVTVKGKKTWQLVKYSTEKRGLTEKEINSYLKTIKQS